MIKEEKVVRLQLLTQIRRTRLISPALKDGVLRRILIIMRWSRKIMPASTPFGNSMSLSGMFASGEIEIGRSQVLTVPQNAVLLRDGYSYVFRLGPDNRVIQTKVGVGQRSGDRVAVMNGLEPGMAVVSTGVGFLADGDLVRIVESR